MRNWKTFFKNSIAVVFALFFIFSAHAEYLEETGTLESIYENRARHALNTILKPQDYSLVISAEINRDEKKLDEYNKEQELLNLPGMPMPGMQADMPGHNILHDLKSKVEVNLVLNLNVPVDKENIIKGLMLSKLHLDESAGDKITISRAQLAIDEEKPPLLPEYSWKTWIMLTILALLSLAGIIFWASRRQKRDVNVNSELPKFVPTPVEATKKEEPTSEPSPTPPVDNSDFIKKLHLEIQLQRMKDHIISIATQFPLAACKGINDYFNQHNKHDIIVMFEHIGWDTARALFAPLSLAVWGTLGNLIRNKNEELPLETKHEIVARVYNFILSSYLQVDGNKDAQPNPFFFLAKLNRDELKNVLLTEPSKNLAIISLYLESAQFEQFFRDLSAEKHDELAVEIANIKQLPMKSLEILAQNLNTKLNHYRLNPVVTPDGPDIMARILRVLSAEEEFKILQNLVKSNPNDSLKIRRQVLYFPDMVYLPAESVTDILNSRDVSELSAALFGIDPDSQESILALLPKKKAEMVRTDLTSPASRPSPKELAEAWRNISIAVEKELKSKGLSLATYVGQSQYVANKLKMAS